MNIGIVGAGFTGLAAAYTLVKRKHKVTILEKDTHPGGLAIGYKEPNWNWTLEQHYHHWFTNDHSILSLAKTIKHHVLVKRPKTSVYVNGRISQFDSVSSIIRFADLSLQEKIRMGSLLAFLKCNPFWQPLETISASKALTLLMGRKPYELLWKPLLENKFGKFADDISLAWFWARIYKRTPYLAYPREGFLSFAYELLRQIEKRHGKIFFQTEVKEIQTNKKNVMVKYLDQDGKLQMEQYDKLIVTLPSKLFTKVTPQLPEKYKQLLGKIKSLGAINLILRLNKAFLSDGTYWLNVCDKQSPIMAIVEHTNFIDKKYYNNEHIVYLGNYLSHKHRYFSYNEITLLEEYDLFLKQINPNYRKTLIGIRVFKTPFAQPILPINYSRIIPPFQTPLKNVYLANIDQVYPWDRGTNYAVELGEKVATLINNQ